MMPFMFRGAEAGWVIAKRHTNECVPRVMALLSAHTMRPFIALSSALMALASAIPKSAQCGGKHQTLQRGFSLLTSRMTWRKFWNHFGLSVPFVR